MCLLKKINLYLLIVIAFVAVSCRKAKTPVVRYYPVDSLIRAQVNLLAQLQAGLTKKANINGKEEIIRVVPTDTAAWLKELDAFAALSTINKPANFGNYTLTESSDGHTSNLSVRTITSRADLPIAWLKIYYREEPQNLRRIEALYRDENALMKGTRMLVMEFEEWNTNIVLTSYSVEGGQEMFLGKPVEYSIIGTVSIN